MGDRIERAIILSAGQGSRLLPLTAERPKCLIDFSGRSLIAWQIEMLSRQGVTEFHVVTGFMTDMVEAELEGLQGEGRDIHLHFNPFFKVADNLGSCWIARDAMQGDFLILNGDTLISEDIVAKVQAGSDWPIAVTIEGAWEIVENSPAVIDRYRTVTMAWGYSGDSVLNSMSDLGAMAIGFWIASRLPWQATLAMGIALELIALIAIRDNLTLNVLMLLFPIEAIAEWQGGA
mgnify:CR=1 FL=1